MGRPAHLPSPSRAGLAAGKAPVPSEGRLESVTDFAILTTDKGRHLWNTFSEQVLDRACHMGRLVYSTHQSLRSSCPLLNFHSDSHAAGAITRIRVQVCLPPALILFIIPLEFPLPEGPLTSVCLHSSFCEMGANFPPRADSWSPGSRTDQHRAGFISRNAVTDDTWLWAPRVWWWSSSETPQGDRPGRQFHDTSVED